MTNQTILPVLWIACFILTAAIITLLIFFRPHKNYRRGYAKGYGRGKEDEKNKLAVKEKTAAEILEKARQCLKGKKFVVIIKNQNESKTGHESTIIRALLRCGVNIRQIRPEIWMMRNVELILHHMNERDMPDFFLFGDAIVLRDGSISFDYRLIKPDGLIFDTGVLYGPPGDMEHILGQLLSQLTEVIGPKSPSPTA